MKSIRDQHSFKNDVYPNILHEAYKLLEIHSSMNKNQYPRYDDSWVPRGGSRGDRITHRRMDRGDRGRGRERRRGKEVYKPRMQYSQVEFAPGQDSRLIKCTQCYQCKKYRHFADFCLNIVETDQHTMSGYAVIEEDDEGGDEGIEEVGIGKEVEDVEPDDESVRSFHDVN